MHASSQCFYLHGNPAMLSVDSFQHYLHYLISLQQGQGLFRPFNKQHIPRICIFRKSYGLQFMHIAQPEKVEVIYDLLRSLISIYDGKSGGGGVLIYAKLPAHRFYQCCFSGTHFAVEKKNVRMLCLCIKHFSYLGCFVQRKNSWLHNFIQRCLITRISVNLFYFYLHVNLTTIIILTLV